MNRFGRLLAIVILSLSTVLSGAFLMGAMGCSTVNNEERPGDPQDLQQEAQNFHRNMRWARYEQASNSVHPAYENEFMGRYEELGDDYNITDIEFKSVDFSDDFFEAVIEVQMEWYQLPSTVVESARFMERWVYVDGLWKLRERMRRDEYRERGRTFFSEDAEAEEESDGEDEEVGELNEENEEAADQE